MRTWVLASPTAGAARVAASINAGIRKNIGVGLLSRLLRLCASGIPLEQRHGARILHPAKGRTDGTHPCDAAPRFRSRPDDPAPTHPGLGAHRHPDVLGTVKSGCAEASRVAAFGRGDRRAGPR